MEKISGIYCIKNINTRKLYIGQSIDIYKEWNSSHKPALKYNRHHNKYLQRAWNKYGESNFKHEIIKECSTNELNYFEKYYINSLSSHYTKKGYNISFGGESIMKGRNHTEKTKEKMSISKQNMSDETKNRMSESRIGKKLNNSSSVYHGVRKRFSNNNRNMYWEASIILNGKWTYIGISKDEISAAKKYNDYILSNDISYPLNMFN
jgi:group I intron endonuclease